MARKDFQKGMEAGAKPFEEKFEKQAMAVERVGKRIERRLDDISAVQDVILGDLSSREKKELYDLNTLVDIADLNDTEKEFLLAVLYTLSDMTEEVTEAQQGYIRSVKKYLKLKDVQTTVDLSCIENIDSKKEERAILQCVMELLFLENCNHDYWNEYDDVLDYFNVKNSEIRKIQASIDAIYKATGAEGLAEKFGYVAKPEEGKRLSESGNEDIPLEVADLIGVLPYVVLDDYVVFLKDSSEENEDDADVVFLMIWDKTESVWREKRTPYGREGYSNVFGAYKNTIVAPFRFSERTLRTYDVEEEKWSIICDDCEHWIGIFESQVVYVSTENNRLKSYDLKTDTVRHIRIKTSDGNVFKWTTVISKWPDTEADINSAYICGRNLYFYGAEEEDAEYGCIFQYDLGEKQLNKLCELDSPVSISYQVERIATYEDIVFLVVFDKDSDSVHVKKITNRKDGEVEDVWSADGHCTISRAWVGSEHISIYYEDETGRDVIISFDMRDESACEVAEWHWGDCFQIIGQWLYCERGENIYRIDLENPDGEVRVKSNTKLINK